jgi:predicted DNA-binding ribbon-helix-helix protein
LAIYIQDHLAGATLGVQLARRAASQNAGTVLGEKLGSVQNEIEQDRATLQSIMVALDISADRFKNTVAWAGEKAGRLKLNGRLTSYSPLSRVVELEGLIAGINGKRALWRSLRDLAEDDPRLQAAQLDELIARADRQLRALWSAHADASREALANSV